MEAIQRVQPGSLDDRHQVLEVAAFAWRAALQANANVLPPSAAPQAELGPGLSDTKAGPKWRVRNAYAEFEVKPDSGEVVVRIIDADTGDVVRTVPPDELVRSLRDGEEWTRNWRVYI
jgi:hypothetical protein